MNSNFSSGEKKKEKGKTQVQDRHQSKSMAYQGKKRRTNQQTRPKKTTFGVTVKRMAYKILENAFRFSFRVHWSSAPDA